MMIPMKTGDIVEYAGKKYAVKRVGIAKSGPVLEIAPLKTPPLLVSPEDVVLSDYSQAMQRVKSVGQRYGGGSHTNIKGRPKKNVKKDFTISGVSYEHLTEGQIAQIDSMMRQFFNQLVASMSSVT